MYILLLCFQKKYLEDKLQSFRHKMTEVDDTIKENEDLQQTILKKDKVIEELERQIGSVVKNSDVQMRRRMEKMRIEYELMARSTVNSKMRKMNEYLNEKLRQQENLDIDKENVIKGIQIDLEERLAHTSNELGHIKSRLKSMLDNFLLAKIKHINDNF